MKRLDCAVQNYNWGKPARESIVAKLKNINLETESTKPFAELWMGTHPNGSSAIKNDKLTLMDYIAANPQYMGGHEQDGLQYLFKVLSVGKALSIQSHPTKKQAIHLHSVDPKNYPDDNHKPEIAIALSQFEVLCSFRPHHEIISNFKAHKELLELVNEEDLNKLATGNTEEQNMMALKALFSSIWKSPQGKIAQVVSDIIDRISKYDNRQDVEDLMLRLNSQYPGGDVGVLAPLFLNHLTLEPGESTFLGPNEPHAYLSGDCVECMACSDNTIRAGLTPKYKDVNTLCENLTYKMTASPYFHPYVKANGVLQYSPPVEEFAVQRISNVAEEVGSVAASSIIIITNGSASLHVKLGAEMSSTDLHAGDIWFIPTNAELTVRNATNDFLCFRAFTPSKEDIN